MCILIKNNFQAIAGQETLLATCVEGIHRVGYPADSLQESALSSSLAPDLGPTLY
jgi:hypothetical protein